MSRVTIPLYSNTPSSHKPLTLSVKKLALTNVVSSNNVAPVDLFKPLSNTPWSIWLDSGQSQHIDACFDIIVWQPEVTLTTVGDQTRIYYASTNKTALSTNDPLLLLEKIQQQTIATQQVSTAGLPFLGGALGYLSYDVGRRFEKLPIQAEQDINLPEMAMGIYSQAVIFDHKKQAYYLVCPEEKRATLTIFLQTLIQDQATKPATKSTTPPVKESFTLTSNWQSNMNKASYTEKFEQVQNYLLSGDCYQINLAQRFTAQYQGNEFTAYCALRNENNAPFSAFIQLENASILSLSPERFLQCKQGKVQSKPIKGTMPRSNNTALDKHNAETLLNSTKDRAENVMIVDLLRNDISKVCKPGSVVVPKLFDIESFPAVHHLVSTVEGEIADQYSANDLLRGAFPGGSITGAPKIRAMEIIEQLEPNRRSVYCGSIGYISSCGTMDTNITIRTLICENNQSKKHNSTSTRNNIYCWAGGGLVADSIASSEYQETFDKVNRILPVLTELGISKKNKK